MGVLTNEVGAQTEEVKEGTPAQVKEEAFKAKSGAYLRFSWLSNSIDGDFDDTHYYHTPTELFNVPDVDDGDGFGIGLGLAIAREIVLAHGGEITASSTVGKGTSFRVELPTE